ncbi:uncharacterized protein YALI1_F07416g [Yarrowia lipolytica]|uniref:Uncharacterized protein n=1 Tax=Yarrowia lipolytica TaxID=4952 RepID=A0A1D8NM23_YARLL|nr:hypothetical protein YALI1_F07416g [Yarrowia lipolytica]
MEHLDHFTGTAGPVGPGHVHSHGTDPDWRKQVVRQGFVGALIKFVVAFGMNYEPSRAESSPNQSQMTQPNTSRDDWV